MITTETKSNVNSLFMRRFRGCQLSWYLLKLPNIYEGVIDASVNTCCKLKIDFWKSVFSFRVDSILK